MRGRGVTITLALLALAGCHSAHVGGQTLALVNGEPITRDDVDLELSLLPADQRVGAQAAVLHDLVDRKLLAQDAIARGEGQSGGFVRMVRRDRELLLAQSTAAMIAARNATPAQGQAQPPALARHLAALRAGAAITLAP